MHSIVIHFYQQTDSERTCPMFTQILDLLDKALTTTFFLEVVPLSLQT